MKRTKFPKGWDEERVRQVLRHYDQQSEEEAVAECEDAYVAQTPAGILALALASLADIPASQRDLLTRSSGSGNAESWTRQCSARKLPS